MIRYLYCDQCGSPWQMHSGDVAAGWRHRKLTFAVKKPEDHFITVNGERQDMESIMCDKCGDAVSDGDKVFAITMWRPALENAPDFWEYEFQQSS